MNNEKVKKLLLIRQIQFEARKLTMVGYGKIRLTYEIVDKCPKEAEYDRTAEV